MNEIKKTQKQLNELRDRVIGIYKYGNSSNYELIINLNRDTKTIDTVYVSQFGSIHHEFNQKLDGGVLAVFPMGTSLLDMLQHPLQWNQFLSDFDENINTLKL